MSSPIKLSEIYAAIKDEIVIDGSSDYKLIEKLVLGKFNFKLVSEQVWSLLNHHKKQMVKIDKVEADMVEIVILANSVKHGQHCVAGKCVNTGRWIRPVSNPQGAELNHEQAKYQNPYGTYGVKPLQKIRMGFSRHVPLPHQPENYLIDGNLWHQNFSIGLGDLPQYLDEPVDIWGLDNRVEYARIISGVCSVTQSLYLIQVEGLRLYNKDDGKRRAFFTYKSITYDLAVTDPKFDEIVKDNRELNQILCVSLGEEHNGYCYKLVATIF